MFSGRPLLVLVFCEAIARKASWGELGVVGVRGLMKIHMKEQELRPISFRFLGVTFILGGSLE